MVIFCIQGQRTADQQRDLPQAGVLPGPAGLQAGHQQPPGAPWSARLHGGDSLESHQNSNYRYRMLDVRNKKYGIWREKNYHIVGNTMIHILPI